MELRKGAKVNERLRLVRPVAKGGMGAVWVAYHEGLNTEVAVKFVMDEAGGDAMMLERFKREAEIAAQLKNPHVASVHDHGVCDDGTLYIVMELLEGESLQQRLKRGPLSLHETTLLAGQVARALSKAHKLGIIHRDVKPGNLFLIDADYELFVKLLDFGIAKITTGMEDEELTKTGNVLGSILYMSPEQLTELKHVDHRSDVWALAVVVYRCLAVQAPFNGDAIGNVMLAVVNREYRPITQLRPELPAALDDWFAKAFHAEIEQRYQSAKELALSFQEIALHAPEPDEPATSSFADAAVEVVVLDESERLEDEQHADLPASPGASEPPPEDVVAEPSESAAELAEEDGTFTPAATNISKSDKGRKRFWVVAAGIAALLAGVLYAELDLRRQSDMDAAAPQASPTPPSSIVAEPPPTAEPTLEPSAGDEPVPTTTADAGPAALPNAVPRTWPVPVTPSPVREVIPPPEPPPPEPEPLPPEPEPPPPEPPPPEPEPPPPEPPPPAPASPYGDDDVY